MNSYLVAVRNTKGELHRAPQPIDRAQVMTLIERLKPFQELTVAVLPDPPKEEAPAAAATAAEAQVPEAPSTSSDRQEHS